MQKKADRQSRRRKKRDRQIEMDELFSLCKQLLREQESLRAAVEKTRSYAGVPDSDSSELSGTYTPDSRFLEMCNHRWQCCTNGIEGNVENI